MTLFSINFAISTNEDWVDSLVFVSGEEQEPLDLSGSSFKMQLRTVPEKLTKIDEFSTENSRLVIEPAIEDVGKLSIVVPKETVDNISPGVYVYDLVWTMADGRAVNLAAGTVTVKLGITR